MSETKLAKEPAFEVVPLRKLTEKQRELVQCARNALGTAYAPYTRLPVGAALRTSKGKIITASNFETAGNIGVKNCAERIAVFKANSEGERDFEALAVVTEKGISPCGTCRQVLYEVSEISGKDIEVILSTTDGSRNIITSVRELLPLAYGPRELGINVSRYRRT
jgi:cytidine deaminase